jgi:hypothetical protein
MVVIETSPELAFVEVFTAGSVEVYISLVPSAAFLALA